MSLARRKSNNVAHGGDGSCLEVFLYFENAFKKRYYFLFLNCF
jgi:hypothetical protein